MISANQVQEEFSTFGQWQTRFENSSSVTCVLDEGRRLIYCNPAWDAFALYNNGIRATSRHVLGQQLFDYIPEVLQDHYDRLLLRAALGRKIVGSDYECNTDGKFRKFRLVLLPIPKTNLLAMVHALRIERPMTLPSLDPAICRFPNKAVTMCAQCRRTKGGDCRWNWVPDFVRNPPERVSHGICPECMMYLYV
ncbi:MAG: PAS domain-containing protein [Terriglobales bacterium]